MPKSKRNRRSNRSKSGFIGVYKLSSEKYQAQISIGNGKQRIIGLFDTAKQAAKAYDKEAIKLRRPFFKLNYPKKAPAGYTPIQQTLRSNNTVGYRGVCKMKKRWQAQIVIDGKKTNLGTYDTAKEAAIAYDRSVLKANKSTALLNFPDMVHNLDVEPKRKKYTGSSTGYRGVQVSRSGHKFTASMRLIKGKNPTHIGTFDTAIQAALAYDQAAIKNGNKNSTLNFPKDQKKKQKQKKQVKEKKQKKTKKKDLLTIQEYKEMLEIWNDME